MGCKSCSDPKKPLWVNLLGVIGILGLLGVGGAVVWTNWVERIRK